MARVADGPERGGRISVDIFRDEDSCGKPRCLVLSGCAPLSMRVPGMWEYMFFIFWFFFSSSVFSTLEADSEQVHSTHNQSSGAARKC